MKNMKKEVFCGLLLSLFIVVFPLSTFAQVTVSANNTKIRQVLSQIEKTSDYSFFYSDDYLDLDKKISISLQNESIETVLDKVFQGTNIYYGIGENKQILLTTEDLKGKPVVIPEKNYTGTITDETGEPFIGASIHVKNTSVRAITDVNGKFSLSAPVSPTLVISYVGYVTQEIKAGNQTNLEIILKEDPKLLNEVVVVGYGIQKKINLTGAVATINVEKEMESRPLTNLSQTLSGMAAGLQVMQNSGRPNSDGANIKIRGIGTLNNSDPLILVDGLEASLNDVNPNDVASISILKDAASCAIYGNRGANGVILITTKTGETGKTTVNYSGLFSFNQPSNLIKLVSNSADYFELMNESAYNIGQSAIFSQNTIDTWREAEKDPDTFSESGYPNYVAYPNTDWYKTIFQNKLMQEHTVSVVGASNRANYNVSGSFLDNPGLIDGTGLKKYYIRSNVLVDINGWLKIGNRSHGFITDLERNDVDSFLTGIHGQKLPPDIYPVYDGKYGMPEAREEDPTSANVFHLLNSTGGSHKFSQVNTAMFADAKLLKDFLFHVEFDYKWSEQKSLWTDKRVGRFSFRENVMVEQPITLERFSSSFYTLGLNYWRFLETLTWNKTFGLHEIGALVGYEATRSWAYDVDTGKQGASDESITDLSTFTDMLFIRGGQWESSSRSFFGRITYVYNSRYLLELNTRSDGSSRFAPESRWGLFPSISAGWRISEETFMKSIPLNNLKLRASWGKLGNNSIGDYEWQATYGVSSYVLGDKLNGGLAQTVLANSQLRWESVTQTNIGLDIATLRNRLSGEIDLYNKVTDGILYRPNTYATMGNKTPARQNFAEVTNRGIETTLNWNDRIGDVIYDISGNFSYNKNWVSKFKGALKKGWIIDENGNQVYQTNLGDVSDGGNTRVIEGKIINEYYLKQPYNGNGRYFFENGMVNPNGGPKDGMIRTERDMEWLRAMQDEGYTFYPNQLIRQSNLWYGDYIYADLNGDGIYGNEHDREFQNTSAIPKYFYGLQVSASWKGIDFSMAWDGAAGFAIYWYTVGQNSTSTILGYGISQNIQNDHYFYDPANPDDPRTNLTSRNSRLTFNQTNQATEASTLHLEKGDYIKLRNLTIGYTFPQSWTKKVYASKIRVFVTGENLCTITGFSGMDPEMRTGMGYVTLRQLAFGVNINF
jgi:TonB-linked SusC/RagA family outer membrane protein